MSINRAEAEALLSRQDGKEIWQQAAQSSAALRTFRSVNMGKKLTRYPVLAALPNAQFVTGEDVGDPDAMKPVTNASWTHRDLVAEEIAGIVIIPENVLADAEPEFDLWAELRPRIAEAVGKTLDLAVFFGTNSPASWPVGLVPASIAAANVVAMGTGRDLVADFNDAMSLVEDDGFDPSTIYGRRSIRGRVRDLRDDNGSLIFTQTLDGARPVNAILGMTAQFVTNGGWDNTEAIALLGDPNYAILGLRQDLTYKFLDQATVTVDVGGTPTMISLAENDLLGLRFKMRVGFQTAEVPTRDNEGDDYDNPPYPFAVITPGS
jgi:HK97 family phage major capsid protein